jgi:hypothetical protein
VPAAAVIPAPIAYIKVVAVKKLVVEFLLWETLSFARLTRVFLSILLRFGMRLVVLRRLGTYYFEEIRVFQASVTL